MSEDMTCPETAAQDVTLDQAEAGFTAPVHHVDQTVYSGDRIAQRLDAIEAAQRLQAETLEGIREGVNTIGAMMNDVADAFGKIMEQVSKGGIGALLGGMMGK